MMESFLLKHRRVKTSKTHHIKTVLQRGFGSDEEHTEAYGQKAVFMSCRIVIGTITYIHFWKKKFSHKRLNLKIEN